MDRALYFAGIALVKVLQALPLLWVARIGRWGGGVAYWLDARHRRVALANLTRCFGHEKSRSEIRALARENFRRLGENYCSAVKTAAMTWEELKPHVQFAFAERIPAPRDEQQARSCIVAFGHFGNFELYARFGECRPGFQCAATYRGLKQPALSRLMQSMRQQSGCLFFERRTDADALKAALSERSLLLGLAADQHAGRGGVIIPFLGHECSASPAAAILALRYKCPLHTGVCYRVALGRWVIEAGAEIPTYDGTKPRSVEAITRDINRALEVAVRRDPANWFWVHNRWKMTGKRKLSSAARPGEQEKTESILPLA